MLSFIIFPELGQLRPRAKDGNEALFLSQAKYP